MNTIETTEPEVIVNPNAGIICGLREMADFLESHLDVPQLCAVSAYKWYYASDKDIPKVSDVAKALGKCEKGTMGEDFRLTRSFAGGVFLAIDWPREQVCKKVVTKVVKDTYDYPEGTVLPAMVKVRKEVETVTWECPDSILAPSQSIGGEQ